MSYEHQWLAGLALVLGWRMDDTSWVSQMFRITNSAVIRCAPRCDGQANHSVRRRQLFRTFRFVFEILSTSEPLPPSLSSNFLHLFVILEADLLRRLQCFFLAFHIYWKREA